jgi:prolyl-tRNA editing enzyme YbaK/EbsC (Cys-tRNA(Pro) deacylase)
MGRAYVNGGRRGFLVGVAPSDLVSALHATPVDAIDKAVTH